MYAIFDAHCDTVYELSRQKLSLSGNSLQLDIERMEQYDTYIQVFAAYIDKMNIGCSPVRHCLDLINEYKSETGKNRGRISQIKSAQDLESAARSGGVFSILAIEGGEALGGELSALKMYYDLGVRLITLTWNYANELADGITESRGGGLTEFGRQVVRAMEDMGILIDVSHISEKGFWDVAELARYPFVASHSCAKTLCSHQRNLSDEQIRAIIDINGCIGVNFYPEFLRDSKRCSAEAIVDHIEHIIGLGGENSVGLGSDFDGVAYLPDGISGVEDMHRLLTCMKSRGFSDNMIKKAAFDNFYRVFFETMSRVNC